MAITSGPSATSSNPYQALVSNPGTMGSLPGINLPGVQMPTAPSNLQTSPLQVYSLLAQQPQSLSTLIGPLLQQIYGTQGNLMAPLFAQQGQNQAAIAQSDAMRRGLTGSSIEAANINQAYTGANQGFAQYLAQQLNGLVPAYTGAAQFDIGQGRTYQTDLAQAIGQQLSNQISQQQFQQMLNAGFSESGQQSNSQLWSSIIGAGGQVAAASAPYWVPALMSAFSDIRLKKDILPLVHWRGMTWYLYQYRQDKGIKLPKNFRIGLLGHEVARVRPDCVKLKDGYLVVDYGKILNAGGFHA